MAEDKKSLLIKEDGLGMVQVSEDVIAIIAGLAATEVKGVSSLAGNVSNDIISRLGTKNLAKGVKVAVEDNKVAIGIVVNIAYGVAIPEVCTAVQDKVKSAVENMTGLAVVGVNVRVAEVDMKSQQ